MLDNPHTGQSVRVAEEYRDEWPVHNLGDQIGVISGIGNYIVVKFGEQTIHVPRRFLEGVE